MLTNVNLRKLSYAVTPAGITELTVRSQTLNVTFIERNVGEPIIEDAFCVVGKLCEETGITHLTKTGCVNLLDLIEE